MRTELDGGSGGIPGAGEAVDGQCLWVGATSLSSCSHIMQMARHTAVKAPFLRWQYSLFHHRRPWLKGSSILASCFTGEEGKNTGIQWSAPAAQPMTAICAGAVESRIHPGVFCIPLTLPSNQLPGFVSIAWQQLPPTSSPWFQAGTSHLGWWESLALLSALLLPCRIPQ